MRQTAITFFSGDLSLDGVLGMPDGPARRWPAVAVCHPHPVLGGDKENPVVMAVCRELAAVGFASLRFDFRGVGSSEGEFTNGDGEQADVTSALDALRHWPGIDGRRLAVAGYSFGAAVALRAIGRLKDARSLALIAPPVSALRDGDAARDGRPMLFVAGERDRIAPPDQLRRALNGFAGEARFFIAPGADHSLRGAEAEVATQVSEFISTTA